MDVLVVARTGVRTSDAALLLSAALRRRGLEVELLPVDRDLPAAAAAGLAERGDGDPVYRHAWNRRFRRVVRTGRPSLVIVYGSAWGLTRESIDAAARSARVVLWEVNGRGGLATDRCRGFHHVFLLDSAWVAQLRDSGLRQVSHLPACADPTEHSDIHVTDADRDELACDICFVGTAHLGRIAALEQLAEFDVRVYGPGWREAAPSLASSVRDEPVYGVRKSKLYASARLTLNVRGPHMVWGENFRVFEVAACGGVSLSESSPDLVRCFDRGTEVAILPSGARRAAAVRELLGDASELAALARRGRARVLAEHTYDHRAAQILEVARAA